VKILLDSCVWGKAKEKLIKSGFDVIWSGEWKKDPGDEEILDFATQEGRVLVTLDKDFGELAILNKKPHNGIIRLVNISATIQANYCIEIIRTHS